MKKSPILPALALLACLAPLAPGQHLPAPAAITSFALIESGAPDGGQALLIANNTLDTGSSNLGLSSIPATPDSRSTAPGMSSSHPSTPTSDTAVAIQEESDETDSLAKVVRATALLVTLGIILTITRRRPDSRPDSRRNSQRSTSRPGRQNFQKNGLAPHVTRA